MKFIQIWVRPDLNLSVHLLSALKWNIFVFRHKKAGLVFCPLRSFAAPGIRPQIKIKWNGDLDLYLDSLALLN